jgi:hypothetical protein
MFEDMMIELSAAERAALRNIERKIAAEQEGDLFDDLPTETLGLDRWHDRPANRLIRAFG